MKPYLQDFMDNQKYTNKMYHFNPLWMPLVHKHTDMLNI
jgi:hypothetical protein